MSDLQALAKNLDLLIEQCMAEINQAECHEEAHRFIDLKNNLQRLIGQYPNELYVMFIGLSQTLK